jgi:hypothetical protein
LKHLLVVFIAFYLAGNENEYQCEPHAGNDSGIDVGLCDTLCPKKQFVTIASV